MTKYNHEINLKEMHFQYSLLNADNEFNEFKLDYQFV